MKRGMRYTAVITFTVVVILVSLTLVSAETFFEEITNTVRGWFSGITGDIFKVTDASVSAQILLFFLVALIVYAVSDHIPFLEQKGWIAALISIVIALLATLYLKSEEIATILQSYGALGIALTIVVPFILIAVISKRLHQKEHMIMAKLLWIVFIVAIAMKFLTAQASEIGTFGKIFSLVAGILALIMLIWENKVYLFLWKEQLKSARDTSQAEALSDVTAQLTELRDKILAAPSEAVAQPLIQKFNRLVKRQNELGGNWKEWG